MIENKKAKELVKCFCSKCNDYLITDYTNSLHYCLFCNIWSKAKGDNKKTNAKVFCPKCNMDLLDSPLNSLSMCPKCKIWVKAEGDNNDS